MEMEGSKAMFPIKGKYKAKLEFPERWWGVGEYIPKQKKPWGGNRYFLKQHGAVLCAILKSNSGALLIQLIGLSKSVTTR